MGRAGAESARKALGLVKFARGCAGFQGEDQRARDPDRSRAGDVLLHAALQGPSDGAGAAGETRSRVGQTCQAAGLNRILLDQGLHAPAALECNIAHLKESEEPRWRSIPNAT
jgi:hypothetical protein